MSIHRFPIRVYYEDTDAGGVIYHANYIKFAERARTEALRTAGIDQSDLWTKEGIGFVVRRIVTDYTKPGRLDDLLEVETTLEEFGQASVTILQTVKRGADTLATLHVKLAIVDREIKLVKLSDALKATLTKIFG
jgi:acyl-CoA thioester hydrolase